MAQVSASSSTVIVERRRDLDFLAGFLVIALGFAAVRGWNGAPVIAGALGLGAFGIAIVWLRWRRAPAFFLAITPDEIWFGRVDKPGVTISRSDGDRLDLRQESNASGWFLSLADAADGPRISMIGFDPAEVRRACVEHGWTVV